MRWFKRNLSPRNLLILQFLRNWSGVFQVLKGRKTLNLYNNIFYLDSYQNWQLWSSSFTFLKCSTTSNLVWVMLLLLALRYVTTTLCWMSPSNFRSKHLKSLGTSLNWSSCLGILWTLGQVMNSLWGLTCPTCPSYPTRRTETTDTLSFTSLSRK